MGEEKKLILTKDEGLKLMSLEDVYLKFERLLYKLVHSWKYKFEEEDLIQISIVGLIKAFKTYDLNKNVLFMTYLVPIVNNEIAMFNRKEKRHLNIDSLDRPIFNQDNESISLMDLMKDETDYENKSVSNVIYAEVVEIIENLNERDKKIIKEFYFNNKTQKEIGKELGLSQSYVSRILKNTPNIIKKEYEGANKMALKEPKITKEELMEEAKVLGTGKESISEISRKYGLTEKTVNTYLWKYGIRDKLKEREARSKLKAKELKYKMIETPEYKKETNKISQDKVLQPLLLRGKVMEYKVQDKRFLIKNINGTTTLFLNANEIDDFIKELKALKNVV